MTITIERNQKIQSLQIINNIYIVGSQIAAHTLMETGNGLNEPNTIDL